MEMVKSFWQRVRYSSFLVFHPFKGFWDLKHEGIGTVGVASLFLLVLALTQVIATQFSGFIVNYTDTLKINILYVMIRTVAIFMVWVLANWSITTLMDGEGKIRDIYITTAYALVPYIVSSWIAVLLSNFIVAEEATFNGVPCLTLNTYTEHIETVKVGTNELVGVDPEKIAEAIRAIRENRWKKARIPDMWDGRSAERIVQILNT